MTTSKENIRKRLGPVITYILFAVIAACIFDRALAAQREIKRLLRDRNRLQWEINHIRQRNAWREKILSALSSDPFYVERLLRERYGYMRPGETPQVHTSQRQPTVSRTTLPPSRH